MRLAVAGSHATGKTSLVFELARRHSGVTTFDEPYYLLEAEGHAFGAPPTRDDFELLLARSVALLVERHPGTIIFDRSPADYLAYLAAEGRQTLGRDLVTDVTAALATLDLVVFVPIEHPDRIAGVDAPRLRRRVDAILHEMLADGAWDFEVPVFEVHGTLEQRADQVEARLASMLR